MRWRPQTWFLLSLFFLVMGACFWHWGNVRVARQQRPATNAPPAKRTGAAGPAAAAFNLLSRPGAGAAPAPAAGERLRRGAARDGYRLSNTPEAIRQLLARDSAILLQNAFLDTRRGLELPVPAHLRAGRETRSYLVQARGLIDDAFRQQVFEAGAEYVSYIPNNTFLVRVDRESAQRLAEQSRIQAVVPYEPYFKLDRQLLALAAEQQRLPGAMRLSVTVFSDGRAAAARAFEDLGSEILHQGRSPFGPYFVIRPEPSSLASLARLDEVQGIEVFPERVLLNDLTRVRLAVAEDLTAGTNYLDLTGSNVVVNLNDSGVDSQHPDLAGRVITAFPAVTTDPVGHGTHVGGTIASSGTNSAGTAPGSPTNANFRGMAPAAQLFALPVDLLTGPLISDEWLQETAAANYFLRSSRTNAHLSNNSWGYRNLNEYNVSSASFDAAVRDSLPEVPGSQSILYVFGAGNDGFGTDTGIGGVPGSIISPATAKNVITVGGLENFREITNEVVSTNITMDAAGNSVTNFMTNQVFFGSTDSATEVANFSSRGNVGIGLEGDFGRYKPDVVAPGTFIVSTRARGWTDPEAFTNVTINTTEDLALAPGAAYDSVTFVPDNANRLVIRVLANARSPNPFPGLPIFARLEAPATDSDLVGTNQVSIPPDRPLAPGFWFYRISNPHSVEIDFDVQTLVTVTNESADYFAELEKLNDALEPHYRFESGVSMSAGAVSGTLALIQEFFEREQMRYSPALLKALLINGARSAGPLYDFQVRNAINFQGWGVPNLTNTLPAAPFASTATGVRARFIDQHPTNALATGQSNSWTMTLAPNATQFPLRVTLVWTDPPGNPNAAVKLVNDLDLIVTNRDSGEIYYGNHILEGTDYTQALGTNQPPEVDLVNNVENVFINAPLGTNYVITVYARRVNVNAVTDHPSGIVQDYALVVSSENTGLTNAVAVTAATPVSVPEPAAALNLSNTVPVLSRRVGAHSPLLGGTNGTAQQWNFFVFTNDFQATNAAGVTNGTNVAFITFIPPNLARPRTVEADVDLYVSTNASLLSLNPAAIAGAFKSTARGGTEVITFTNSVDAQVYYVGVKAEDQQGAEYGFVVISSNLPFDSPEGGGRRLIGFPVNAPIPDGSIENPGGVQIFAVGTHPGTVGKVVASLTLTHQNWGDLLGNLSHNDQFVVLNNHSPPGFGGTAALVYDDQMQFPGSMSPDGPGSLSNFIGERAAGLWLLTMVDNSLNHTGFVNLFELFIEPGATNGANSFFGSAAPNSFAYFAVDVPPDATNLTVSLSGITPPLPLDLYLRRDAVPTQTQFDKFALISPPGGSLTIGTNDVPPLNAGRYFIGVFNPNTVQVDFTVTVFIGRNLDLDLAEEFTATDTPRVLRDDAVTSSIVTVDSDRPVIEARVGVRIDHPRVSDLALHLISPQGSRVLLMENRGGGDTNGLGAGGAPGAGIGFAGFTESTNLALGPIKFVPPPYSTNVVVTNVPISNFDAAAARSYNAGEIVDGWQVLTNRVTVLSTNIAHSTNQVLALELGRIWRVLPTRAGEQYTLTFAYRAAVPGVVNAQVLLDGELKRFILGTTGQWQTLTLAFRAARNGTTLELAPVFTNPGMLLDTFELLDPRSIIFYQPEESLELFKGERGLGDWRLEVWDSRVGPANAADGVLLRWELQLVLGFTNQPAIRLTNGICHSGRVSGAEIKYFIVDVPRSTTLATNLLFGAGDLALLFNQNGLPSGINPGDVIVDDRGAGGGEILVLDRNAATPPRLLPGQRYYLGVQNSDARETNDFVLCVDFDRVDGIVILTNGIFYSTNIPPAGVFDEFDYYGFNVSSNAQAVVFDLYPANGNVDLVVKKDLPLPTTGLFDYLSQNPGTNAEVIFIDGRSNPVPLSPGWWYLGVYNVDTNTVAYSIRATEITNLTFTITRLTNNVPHDSSVGPGAFITNYFLFTIDQTNAAAMFELYNLTGNADLYLQFDDLPSTTNYYQRSLSPGTYPEKIILRTNSSLPTLNGDWFLAVVNVDRADVDFTIRASLITNTPIITLTNDVPYTNAVAGGIAGFAPEIDYYRFPVSSNVLYADFVVSPTNGNVELILKKDLPLPDLAGPFDYSSTNAGLATEFIRVRPGSQPVPLSPGDWYLGVYRETNGPAESVAYTVRATEYFTDIMTLTNRVPRTRTIPVNDGLDFYQFTVSTNATEVTFEVFDQNGAVDLYARYGLPLPGPGPGNADYSTETQPPTDKRIVVGTNSFPVRLQPGIWYLSVTNRDVLPVTYTIMASESTGQGPPGTNVVPILRFFIRSNEFCMTWASRIGADYVVQGKTNIDDVAWQTISPAIRATDTNTTYCVPLSGPHRFFNVIEFSEPAPGPDTNVVILRFQVVSNQFCITWASSAGAEYLVQGKTNIDDTVWDTVSPAIRATGTNTTFCVPLSSPYRFYNVVQTGGSGPGPTNQVVLSISSAGTNAWRVSWSAPATQRFQAEHSPSVPATSWTAVPGMITSTTGSFEFVDDGSQTGGLGNQRFYRVRQVP